MAISRQKKETVVSELTDTLTKAPGAVFVGFHGLSVSEETGLRRALQGEGVQYRVAKKTLLRRALAAVKTEGTVPELSGEVALSWGDDEVAPARELATFMKKNEDKLTFLGGVLDGRFITALEVTSLASIPSREVLLGTLLGTLNAPITNFAGVLNNTVGSFVRVLSAVAELKS